MVVVTSVTTASMRPDPPRIEPCSSVDDSGRMSESLIVEPGEVMRMKTRLRGKGQITLPAEVRKYLHVREGDDIAFTLESGRVVLTGLTEVPTDQSWFWTEGWQQGEREVNEQIARGEGTVHGDGDEFLAALDER
ncbi:AbrB/MazE/SpoVT family DNA-binding domain-containing protein [Acidipropionibacterium virtanenii]|nr:AbrB/MazE/SpoVT family DNA-binding domain-containing protein [Acidipropionibacterium virtanenii]